MKGHFGHWELHSEPPLSQVLAKEVRVASGQVKLGEIAESEWSPVLSLGGGDLLLEHAAEPAGRLFREKHNTWH